MPGPTAGLGAPPPDPAAADALRKVLAQHGEGPGGRAGTMPGPQPPAAPPKVFPGPMAVQPGTAGMAGWQTGGPAQTSAAYTSSVNDNLQYLNAAQRVEAQGRQEHNNLVQSAATKAADQLNTLIGLGSLGPAGVRQQQATLNQHGYKLAVDGNMGAATAAAMKDYTTKQFAALNTTASASMAWAHPLQVRKDANATFTPQVVSNDRSFILGYVTSHSATLNTAITQARTDMNNGKQGAAAILASDKQALAGLVALRASAMDPSKGMDPSSLHDNMLALVKSEQDLLKAQNHPTSHGFWSRGVGLFGASVLKVVNDILSPITTRLSQGIAAEQLSGFNGGGMLQRLQAFDNAIAGGNYLNDVFPMPGVPTVGQDNVSKYGEMVNTSAKRQALYNEGKILSPGQLILGNVTPQFAAAHPGQAVGLAAGLYAAYAAVIEHKDPSTDPGVQARMMGMTTTIGGVDASKVPGFSKQFDIGSAIVDFAVTVLQDPTQNGVYGKLVEPFANFGNIDRALAGVNTAEMSVEELNALKVGLRQTLLETPITGRALTSRVGDIVDTVNSAVSLQKRIPGLDTLVANEAMAAKLAKGVEAGKQVIIDAFTSGKWEPHITLVKQLTNDIGGRLHLIGQDGTSGLFGVEASLGKAAKATDRLSWVRSLATGKGPIGSAFETNAGKFVDSALQVASSAVHTSIHDLWTRLVEIPTQGVDALQRFWNVTGQIADLSNPSLQAAFEGTMRPFFTDPGILKSVPLANYLEAAINQPGFEAALQKMELLAAVAGGKGGDAALVQLSADLARGFLLPANPLKEAFQNAASNLGLKLGPAAKGATRKDITAAIKDLPAQDRKFFEDRLAKLSGKKGLGRLATDIKLAQDNPALREEFLRLVEQQKGRAEQAAAAIQKPGLALMHPVRSAARLVLSNMDIMPPVEFRFEHGTQNALYHAELRAKEATRYLDAGHVPEAIKSNIVRAAELVKTEEQHAAVADRMTRAVMEQMGIQNPDAVLNIIHDAGTIRSEPLRAVYGGKPTSDLQMLTERVETVPLPSSAKLAAAVRQSVIDGTESASKARKIAARLRVEVADSVGNINLHYTNFSGKEMTIAMTARATHNLWKFLMITNAGLPLFGALGGFVGTRGSIGDRLHNAGMGFAIGALGPLHYITRTAGIMDRMRILLDQGLTADVHIPAWASIKARRYGEDALRRTISDDLVRIGNHGTNMFDNQILTHTDPAWEVLSSDHPRAPEALGRILNDQIHPESDPIAEILLREHAGQLGGTEQVTRVVTVQDYLAEQAKADAARAAELKAKIIPAVAGADQLPVDAQAGLFKEAYNTAGAAADTRTPLQQEADKLAASSTDHGVGATHTTNEDLLASTKNPAGGMPDTRTYWRGEDNKLGAEYPNRGDGWIRSDYNGNKGEQYARAQAGPDGRVYSVELPVGKDNLPLVGTAAGEGKMGWVLAGQDAKWADAATMATPSGFAATEADRTLYRTVTSTVEVTGRQSADRQIAEFLNTEEGKLWKERWQGALGGTSNPKVAVRRMRNFIETYSTPGPGGLSDLRVSGGVGGVAHEVDMNTIRRVMKDGLGPAEVHAQQVWKMPHSVRELYQNVREIPHPAKAAVETIGRMYKGAMMEPSNWLNRGPFFRSEFYKEYDRLVMQGAYPKEIARQLADIHAANHVNAIMHIFSEQSVFAHKVDMFMPFQHAREDTIRVYFNLATAHPIRTIGLIEQTAKLFNNGKNMGMFTKNEFTGQWEMSVPGSGVISNWLFKVPFDSAFTTNIKDTLFAESSGYGMGFAPKPGGPFWSVASKLLSEVKPELFVGKNPIQKWLWSYGPGGSILGAQNSRLWMAMTGATPPWELANREHWANEHNHYQTEIAQQLVYQHLLKNPTDLGWLPDQATVDDATKKFYETWAFMGTSFPSTVYPTLTGESKYWSARNSFTVGGTVKWDPQAFLLQYPEFEPYMVGATGKYSGPQDAASLKMFGVLDAFPSTTFDPKTGRWVDIPGTGSGPNYSAQSQLGDRTYPSFAQFRDDFKLYHRQGQYYTALQDAIALGKTDPLAGEHALTNVNKMYPDVVAKYKRSNDITVQLYNIRWQYPKNQQAAATLRVQNQYGLKNSDLHYFQGLAANPAFLPSAWKDARTGMEVDQQVRAKFGNTITGGTDVGTMAYGKALKNGSVENYVATLNPAEQANYWQYQRAALGYDPNLSDPFKTLKQYQYFTGQLSAVYNAYPFLSNKTATKDYTGTPATNPNYGRNVAPEGDIVGAGTPDQQFQYPTVTLVSTPDIPGGTHQVDGHDPMARFTPNQANNVVLGLWKEISRLYPQYTRGVHLHLWATNDPRWKALGGASLGRGDAQGNVYIDMGEIHGGDVATARFVLAKELGQANVNKFITSPAQAATYHKALGYTGPVPKAGEVAANSVINRFLAYQTDFQRSKVGGKTNPSDWFGRDFANALGFHSPEADSNFTPTQITQLQAAGVLPNAVGNLYSATYKPYVNPYTAHINAMNASLTSQGNAVYDQIAQVKTQMDASAGAKNWKAYYALKGRQDQLYQIAGALHNKLMNDVPNLTQYYDDMHAAAIEGAAGNAPLQDHYAHQAAVDKAHAPYYLINEQQRFLNYPEPVKRAYMQTLVEGLDMPYVKGAQAVTKYVTQETGLKPLLWSYLTPTQQDLLSANFPQYVERWQYNSAVAGSGQVLKTKATGTATPAEITWAHAQLAYYSKRGTGAPPAAYAHFVNLPPNLAVREQFLNAHPDVRAYINAGPYGHMPPTIRDQVTSILNKWGPYNSTSAKYSRGGRGRYNPNTYVKDRHLGRNGNLSVAWAKEQLYIWSRRAKGSKAPSAYDQWVNMPTGVAKADFLKSHPEIEAWLKLGPMANMPQEYQAVVRDIMTQYGQWTQKLDPLGATITQFFATPGYARQAFLAAHPELEAYWAATRSTADQQMSDLQNQYFKIQDVNARKAFLAAHPELQQHFIDSRTKRYETFLNQVAVFMGANPNMFQQYLTRQTDIMAELLRKFAEPNVIREVGPNYVAPSADSGTRQRAPERAPRVRASA